MPKVSIIIPTFNSEKYIRETLESVVYQTLEDIEIIIADCESKDKTLEIINEYAKNDSRIKVLHRPLEFVGLSRNAALDAATGDYIMFLDSDDMFLPEACEEAYNQISQNGDDVVIFDFCEYIDETKNLKYKLSKIKAFTKEKNGQSFYLYNFTKPFISGAEVWYRIYDRKYLESNQIRFSEEKFCEDIPFTIKSLICSHKVSILNKPLCVHRIYGTSSSTLCSTSHWKDTFTTRQKAYQYIISSNHSKEYMPLFLPYFINSIIYWYRRWSKIKGFPKQAYYEEMHKFFAILRKRHSTEILAVKNYVNDYNFYKIASKHNWAEYRLLLILKPVFSITPEKTHKVIRLFGFKIKIKNKTDAIRKKERMRKDYIKLCKSYSRNIERIKEKVKNGEKIRVAFYVNDTRWKCQNLFDLLLKSKNYKPFVLVGRHSTGRYDFEYQTEEELNAIINYYKSKNMEVYSTYDYTLDKHINLEKFSPDIIFYSRPFGLTDKHNAKSVCNYAVTCYVPYFISNSPTWLEAGEEFQNNLWKYFLINNDLKNEYAQHMENKGANLSVVGYPLMETYLEEKHYDNKEGYVIYAPHCSLGKHILKYATFDWNGKEILEFAKAHPEIKWVFKPHPILKGKVVETGLMTEEEVEEYWNEWDKIGIKYEGPDYLDLFKQSKAMITDCGSFLAEYMPTKNPVILLRSKKATAYNFLAQNVTKYYYSVWNLEQLEEQLNKVILQDRDPWKERRLAMLDSLQLVNNASQNIINDLNKEFGIKTKD